MVFFGAPDSMARVEAQAYREVLKWDVASMNGWLYIDYDDWGHPLMSESELRRGRYAQSVTVLGSTVRWIRLHSHWSIR